MQATQKALNSDPFPCSVPLATLSSCNFLIAITFFMHSSCSCCCCWHLFCSDEGKAKWNLLLHLLRILRHSRCQQIKNHRSHHVVCMSNIPTASSSRSSSSSASSCPVSFTSSFTYTMYGYFSIACQQQQSSNNNSNATCNKWKLKEKNQRESEREGGRTKTGNCRSGEPSTIVVMKRNETNQSMRHVSGRTCSSWCCLQAMEALGQWTVDTGYSSNRNYKTFVQVYKMQHILLFLFLSLLRFVFSFILAVFAFDWPHSSCVNVLGPFGSLSFSLCLSRSVWGHRKWPHLQLWSVRKFPIESSNFLLDSIAALLSAPSKSF